MKGKLFLLLFALPFFGVGVWMGYSIGSNLIDAWQMQQWTPVDAVLHRAGYETHSGDDSNTYKAYAEFSYSYGGQQYLNDRVAISGGGDNIGDYQQDLGRRLGGVMGRGESVTVYVNPADPSDSIVDPTIRWGLLGFKAIFFFVFGGVGLGLLIATFRAPKEKDLSAPNLWASRGSQMTNGRAIRSYPDRRIPCGLPGVLPHYGTSFPHRCRSLSIKRSSTRAICSPSSVCCSR